MATFTDIVKKQRKSGKGIGRSLLTAMSERAKERIDPRNYLFKKDSAITALFPSLGGYQAKTGAEKLKSENSGGFSESAEDILNSMDRSLNLLKSQMKMVAKNSIVLPQMARDTNITKRNIQQLVKSLGVKPTYDNDMFFQNRNKRESQYQNAIKEKKPTKEKKLEEKEKKGFFATLLDLIKDFIGPIIMMIKDAAMEFVSGIMNSVKGLGFLALLLGPEAALAAGFVALAAGLVWLANLIPKPSAENLAEIKKTQDGYWKDIYNRNPDAVPKVERDKIENENKDKGGVITEKIEPASSNKSSVVPAETKLPAGSNTVYGNGPFSFQDQLEKDKKEKSGGKAGFSLKQILNGLFDTGPSYGASISGPVDKPLSAVGQSGIPLTKPEPFTKDLSTIVPFRSKNNDVSAFKHREGIDLAVQSIINKGLGGSTIDAVTGLNDKFHHEEKKGSLHTFGLAADFGLSKNTSKEDIDATVIRIQADLAKAGLQPNEYLVQSEKEGEKGATAPHIHLEFKSASAAAKYAEYAKKTYNLSPSKYAVNENKVPSQSDMDKAAAAGNASLNKNPSSVVFKKVEEAAKPAINIQDSSRSSKLNDAIKEAQELERKIQLQNTKDAKPINVIQNSYESGKSQQAAAPMVAPSVYDTALDWYFRKLA
jgi:hypothetical protein